MCIIQRRLMLKQHIVHLPEFALQSCRFGGTSGMKSMWMALCQREVPKGKQEFVSHFPFDSFEDNVRPSAVGALIVTILKKHNARICASPHMISVLNRQC